MNNSDIDNLIAQSGKSWEQLSVEILHRYENCGANIKPHDVNFLRKIFLRLTELIAQQKAEQEVEAVEEIEQQVEDKKVGRLF